MAQSICYSPTKTRETRCFSEELSPHLPPLYHIQTYRTLNPKPNQPYSRKILTSRAGGVSQRALYGVTKLLVLHRTSNKCSRTKMSAELFFSTLRQLTILYGISVCNWNSYKVLACQLMVNFIMKLLYSRYFMLYTSDGQASRPFRTKNRVIQESVLAPCLYTIYTADIPEMLAKRYMYADDVALTISAPTFREAELALSHDISYC